ncbi:MAG: preprotein translocase subunit SecG [Planctomycetota bacterium]
MDIFLGTLFIVICILLILVVLLQRGRGGGLSAAFGGGGGSGAFGTKTGDVFTWVTIVLTALFLLLAILTVFVFAPPERRVARPVFVPPPEQHPSPGEVQIRCDTPAATVFYTADGSEPTQDNGSKYIRGAQVFSELPVTVKARAYREGFRPSEVATATYVSADEEPETQPTTTAPADAQPAETQPASGTGPSEAAGDDGTDAASAAPTTRPAGTE